MLPIAPLIFISFIALLSKLIHPFIEK
jgi:hypothetical protein